MIILFLILSQVSAKDGTVGFFFCVVEFAAMVVIVNAFVRVCGFICLFFQIGSVLWDAITQSLPKIA